MNGWTHKVRRDSRGDGLHYWLVDGEVYPDALLFGECPAAPYDQGPFSLARFVAGEVLPHCHLMMLDELARDLDAWRDRPGARAWRTIEEEDWTPADEYDRRNCLGRFYRLRFVPDPLLEFHRTGFPWRGVA